MTRRAFGSIDQLQSGRWRARYRDTAGHAHSRLFKTKTDASAFLATIDADLLRGDWNDPRLIGMPLRVWAEQWFETTAHLKPKTRIEYEANLRNHVLPTFGDKPVGAIDALSVRQFVSALRGDGLEHGTVKKAKAVLSMCSALPQRRAPSRPTHAPTSRSVGLRDARWCSSPPTRSRRSPTRSSSPMGRSCASPPTQGFGPARSPPFAWDASTCCAAEWRSPSRSRSCPGTAWSSGRRRTTSGGPFRCRRSSPTSSPSTSPVMASMCSRDSTICATRASRCSSPKARTTLRSCAGSVSSIQVTLDTFGHLFPELEEDVTQRLDAVGRAARSRRAS
jgi:hypothetical protein